MNEILVLQNLLEEALAEKEILAQKLGKSKNSLLEFSQQEKLSLENIATQTELSLMKIGNTKFTQLKIPGHGDPLMVKSRIPGLRVGGEKRLEGYEK